MSPTTTTYGTINSTPTSTSTSAKRTRRPWPELFSISSFSLPISSAEAKTRIKLNLSYFRVNYVIIMLTIVFLTLLWHPTSMIVFLITFIFWWFFYLFNDNPVVVFNKTVDDNIVLGVLSFATVLLLVLTHVGVNVLVGLIIGVVVVGVHAAFRGTEDFGFSVEVEEENGLPSVVGSQPLRPTSGYNRI
ncbi:PRA1 family protein E-like [Durio zibethinus]|uniref:PRA1 family protein n=1 Tax=Durio zibethinus TaxID=66656 RepID=A0A6P5WSN9_DURZI|nr:PRA1 family protein E-like [Durio zibethinus]